MENFKEHKKTDKENLNLEKLSISEKIASVIIAVEYLLCYNNFDGLHTAWLYHPERFRWLHIKESYFWDTPEIFFTIMLAGYIASYANKNKISILKNIQAFLPEISASLIAIYYTLWETLLPQLLPWTPDIKDVPAVIITSIASPIIANYIRRNRVKITDKLKDAIKRVN